MIGFFSGQRNASDQSIYMYMYICISIDQRHCIVLGMCIVMQFSTSLYLIVLQLQQSCCSQHSKTQKQQYFLDGVEAPEGVLPCIASWTRVHTQHAAAGRHVYLTTVVAAMLIASTLDNGWLNSTETCHSFNGDCLLFFRIGGYVQVHHQ